MKYIFWDIGNYIMSLEKETCVLIVHCLICTDQVQLENVLCAKAWGVADGLCRSSIAIMLRECIRALRTLM